MSGDVTYQALKRLSWLPERDSLHNGDVIAGQDYFDVFFAGGTIQNVTISGTIGGFTPSKAIVSNASGVLTASVTSSASLAYLANVTSDIQTQLNGKQPTGNYITALTGDLTAAGPGSVAATLATVNSNVGSFGSATQVATITVNAKGLVTGASNTSIQITESQVTNLTTDLAGKQPLDATLTALASYNTNGLLTQTAADTFTGRTITGTTNRITVTNGNGVAGNPTLDIGTDVVTLTGAQALTNKSINGVTLTSGGSAAQFLNGAGTYAAASSFVSGTAVSASGTSVDFTGIPSTAKIIIISMSGLSTTGASSPIVQMGTSGGAETSGYAGNAMRTVTTGVLNSSLSSGFNFNPSIAASDVMSGSLTLTLISASTNTWACNGTVARTDAAAMSFVAGAKSLSATLDRVRITTVGGTDTFDAGTINISYSS